MLRQRAAVIYRVMVAVKYGRGRARVGSNPTADTILGKVLFNVGTFKLRLATHLCIVKRLSGVRN